MSQKLDRPKNEKLAWDIESEIFGVIIIIWDIGVIIIIWDIGVRCRIWDIGVILIIWDIGVRCRIWDIGVKRGIDEAWSQQLSCRKRVRETSEIALKRHIVSLKLVLLVWN